MRWLLDVRKTCAPIKINDDELHGKHVNIKIFSLAYKGDFAVLVDWLVCPLGSSRISSKSAGDGPVSAPDRSALTLLSPPQ